MINLFLFLIGIPVSIFINTLADDLPKRRSLQTPHCPHCHQPYPLNHWLAWLSRFQGNCPHCHTPRSTRHLLIEIITPLYFAYLPTLISHPLTLFFITSYIAILILIIVIDMEHFLILHIVTLPTFIFALIGSLIVPASENTLPLALVGALVGFIIFYALYWIGNLLFGEGALGFGDVTLSTIMGAMLGFDRIFFALFLAVILGGLGGLLILILYRDQNRYMPYGPYLAIAAMIFLLWGKQIVAPFVAIP
ncbi:MAG TPA: A24 family peptidase [Anaerolineae bacterium]|nr:A24 family peptidase [Anaerolineae bacterium]